MSRLPDPAFWRARRVLMTGHTGFKGSWLALWLQLLGARVVGLASGRRREPSLYALAEVGRGLTQVEADVRDFAAVRRALAQHAPDVVVHLAAQPLVRRSFADPRTTYETNVMGTVNVLEAVRAAGGVAVVVNVTSVTLEPNGGFDPYSSSKACCELVTDAYRRSYFAGPGATRLVTARAGNLIGGGDWAADRLVPDLMRAAADGRPVRLRNPDAVRPWQHVLNPLSGYLVLAEAADADPAFADGWSFGPVPGDARPVRWIADRVGAPWEPEPGAGPPEAPRFDIDFAAASARLGWRPRWTLDEGLARTIEWYAALRRGEDMRAVTLQQIEAFARGG